MRLDYGKTFILGLGFFVITLAWSVYNSYVPIFLGDLFATVPYRTTLVGILMTLDNVAAVTLQPYFGALSDRTWTRLGRRMPFLVAGVPVAAVFFALIPEARHAVLPMVAALIVMNLAMAAFRAPTVALMPDVTPPPLRSQANGVINFMGGAGGIVAYFGLSHLYRVSPGLPFQATSVLMLLALMALLLWVREPRPGEGPSGGRASQGVPVARDRAPVPRGGVLAAAAEIGRDPDRSALRLLLAIFFWFVGWSGVEALFTLYAVGRWGMDPARASFVLGFFAVAFVIFAIPSGYLGGVLGRRRTISVGLGGLALALLSLGIAAPGAGVMAALAAGGMCWALVNIHSYPMVVDMAAGDRVGAYTGLYYFFSTAAAIVAPPAFGLLMDVLGRDALFPSAVASLAVALALMQGVHRGDVPGPAGAAARQARQAA
ncbi:MFS transporter [Carboxydochorda subterranea]|uniref:MFS transporter n=1 Tax=Carboxydichorda subterranea TaxID=3109565 RepID=A0ABZ1BVJ9_9FIRM|nr:MFS transporter [Limnochorda sp. L945t]WRP16162.1 MFS transporter [Limnochorda sp. L945t]